MAEWPHARRGAALVYVVVGLAAFMALVSLGVDVAHVRLAKNQLQGAADAAARSAAAGLPNASTVQNNAVNAGAANIVDGTAVVINPATDVTFGTWLNGAFTVLSGAQQVNANAVQITARRTAAGGNPVVLLFGGLIGKPNCDVTVTSIATAVERPGLIGLNSLTVHNNFFVASYDSSVTTTPNQSLYNSSALVGSNGAISGGSGNTLNGSVLLGPSGSISGFTVSGSTTTLTSPLTIPSVAINNVSNPGGISQAPVIANGQTVTWPGGTYYFTSLTIGDSTTINFSGPAIIYLDGSASLHDFDNITAYNNIPGNLRIYMSSGNLFTLHDSDNIYAQLIAPGSDVATQHDNCNWYGSLLARTISFHDNCSFYSDQSLTSRSVNSTISTVR